jgi:adenylate cyclase
MYVVEFAKGYAAYKNCYWDDAIHYFREALEIYPEDTVARIFISRCLHFKLHPPIAGWNGVWHLHEK